MNLVSVAYSFIMADLWGIGVHAHSLIRTHAHAHAHTHAAVRGWLTQKKYLRILQMRQVAAIRIQSGIDSCTMTYIFILYSYDQRM